MSKFDTRFINFLAILLVLGLMSGLSACGESPHQKFNSGSPEQAIIGGENVTEDSQFSSKVIYLALGVQKKTTPFGTNISQTGICTAAAIAPRILITAAHCVQNAKVSEIYAVTSTNPWNHSLILEEWITVEKIVIHKDFTTEPSQLNNDLALIKLSKDLAPEHISKIASNSQITAASLDLISVGYGQTNALRNPDVTGSSQMDTKPTLLNFVVKKVDPYNVAAKIFSVDQSDMKGICMGDSGGPGYIFDSIKKDYFILGVASFVSIFESDRAVRDPQGLYTNCIGRGNYTNLLPFHDWIALTLNELK